MQTMVILHLYKQIESQKQDQLLTSRIKSYAREKNAEKKNGSWNKKMKIFFPFVKEKKKKQKKWKKNGAQIKMIGW